MVKKIITVIIASVLLSCEWHDSLSQIISSLSCCTTTCVTSSGDDAPNEKQQQEDCKNIPCGILKNCCIQCCYVVPTTTSMVVYETCSNIIFPESKSTTSFFTSDCFHPPELI